MEKIDIKTFLEKAEEYPIIDVRSPLEYQKGHIPKALNVPLFSNEEREEVGICYKRRGKDAAVLLGLEFIGKRMAFVAKRAKKIAKEKTVLVHCWRGGMRSESMAWLFQQVGLKTFVLEGGYKAYRNYVLQQFTVDYNLRVLTGYTGSGKTEVLKSMKEKGEQVVDLEGLAHHKGSAFGSVGQKPQPTTEQFENKLYRKLAALDPQKIIWVEDESQSIGKNFIPLPFFKQMRNAPVLRINLPREVRVKRLVEEYTHAKTEELVVFLEKIRKRLGPMETQQAIDALQSGDKKQSVSLALRFYDKAYAYGLEKRELSIIDECAFEHDDIDNIASEVIKYYRSKIKESE